MDEALPFILSLVVGSVLLLLAWMLRRAATALQAGAAPDSRVTLTQMLTTIVGWMFTIVGLATQVFLASLLVVEFEIWLALMAAPALLVLTVAMCLTVAAIVAHVRLAQRERTACAAEAECDTSMASKRRWTSVNIMTGVSAGLAIATVGVFLGDVYSLPQISGPPPSLMVLGGTVTSIVSLLGLIVLRTAHLLSLPATAANMPERDNLTSSLRTMSIFLIVLGGLAWLVLGLFVLVILALMAVGTFAARQRASGLGALWTLPATLRSGRPLASELAAQAEASTGRVRVLLRRAAEDLEHGMPLSKVLYQSGIVPRSCWLEAAGGLSTGQLPEALRAAAARETARFAESSSPQGSRMMVLYWAALYSSICVIVSFLMYYIVPKLRRIFEDFNLNLPDSTGLMLAIADFPLLGGLSVLMVPVVLSAAIALEGYAMYHGWTDLFERMFGTWRVRWRAPDLLRGLRWAVDANRPLDQALLQMATVPLPMAYRTRLHHAALRIQRGEDPWRILESQGWLTSAEAELLRNAQLNNHLGWALETLSQSSQATREFRLAAFAEFVHPIIVLMIGLVVAAIVYAFFAPLLFMIHELSRELS